MVGVETQDYQKGFRERALASFKEAKNKKGFVQRLRETNGTPDFDLLIAGYMYYNEIDFEFYQLSMWIALICDIFDVEADEKS